MTIPRPSDEQVERHLKCWEKLENYPKYESSLKKTLY